MLGQPSREVLQGRPHLDPVRLTPGRPNQNPGSAQSSMQSPLPYLVLGSWGFFSCWNTRSLVFLCRGLLITRMGKVGISVECQFTRVTFLLLGPFAAGRATL